MGAEGAQVRIDGIEDAADFVVDVCDVALEARRGRVEAKRTEIPLRVVEHHIPHERQTQLDVRALVRSRPGHPLHPAAGTRFAARRQAGIKLLAFGIARTSPDLAHRSHLGAGQTVGRIAGFALQQSGIEMAAPRIVQHAVFHAVEHVASGVDHVGQHLHFMGRKPAVALHRLRDPDVSAGVVPGEPVGRIARHDAVEIGGIALHFGERLLAAERTALEIGMQPAPRCNKPG